MGESQAHLELVQRLVEFAAWRLSSYRAVAVFSDLPPTPRRDKPPRIGGFRPDVFATDVPTTIQLVGEAKTPADLEQQHTLLQLAAFLSHLRIRGGILVIAVPWAMRTVAQRLVQDTAMAVGATGVEFLIIDDISPWH